MSALCARWMTLCDRRALEEPLSAEEQAFVSEHAATCAACAAESAVLGQLEQLLQDRPQHGAPAELAAQQTYSERTERTRSRAMRAALVFAAACAAILFALRRENLPSPGESPQARASTDTRAADARVVGEANAQPSAERSELRISLTRFRGVEVDGRPAHSDTKLRVGSVLSARAGTACLGLEPGIRVCLAKGGRLRVSELSAARRRLLLLEGKAAASLAPQPAGTSFGIVTREGSAIAIGTAFSVHALAEGGPVVTRVLHGTVLVRSDGFGEQRVSAHQQMAMRGTVKPLSAREENQERTLLGQTELAADSEQDEPRKDRARLRGEAASQPSPPRVVAQAAQARAQGDRALLNGHAGPPKGHSPGGTLEVRPASALLSEARELRARGDVGGALRAYRALFAQHGSSDEALAARVAYGEMLLASGAPGAALTAFDQYLAHGGALQREAAFGRVRALSALGRQEDEHAAIDDFLRRFPDGPLADSVRARAQQLRAP